MGIYQFIHLPCINLSSYSAKIFVSKIILVSSKRWNLLKVYYQYSYLILIHGRNSERMIFVLHFYEKSSLNYQNKSKINEASCEYIVEIHGKLFQKFARPRGSDMSIHPEAMHLMEFIEMSKLRKYSENLISPSRS